MPDSFSVEDIKDSFFSIIFQNKFLPRSNEIPLISNTDEFMWMFILFENTFSMKFFLLLFNGLILIEYRMVVTQDIYNKTEIKISLFLFVHSMIISFE